MHEFRTSEEMGSFFFQPYFGSEIVTPPSGRRPVPLIDHVSPPTSDLHDGQGQHNDDPDMEVRGSGVGSDVDVEGMSTLQQIPCIIGSLLVKLSPCTRPKIYVCILEIIQNLILFI